MVHLGPRMGTRNGTGSTSQRPCRYWLGTLVRVFYPVGTPPLGLVPLQTDLSTSAIPLDARAAVRHILPARAHGLWTYEPRQGRKAATVVCSATAVVALAFDFTSHCVSPAFFEPALAKN